MPGPNLVRCWWCEKQFVHAYAKKVKENLLECPLCAGWTGEEIEKPVIKEFHVYDPKKEP